MKTFLILQSLDEHALKNSVILELCDFQGGDRITYFLHIHDKIKPHGYQLFSSLLCHQSVFDITMVSLGIQTYMRCLSLWLDLQYYSKVKKFPKSVKIHDLLKEIQKVTKSPDGRVISSPTQTKQKKGLDVGIGPKRPCQHLCSYFRHFLI